jgi:ferredoxin
MSIDGQPQGPLMVVANLELCQGHARCEDLCPQVFSTDAVEGKVVIVHPVFPPELEDKVRLAVRNCPEGALRIARQKAAGA